ncbi:SIS domain-containing protein [Adlercreutzia sp. ZJ242]|uniref:D-sedoheptulose-7-phosphate isomerase n=1 Tax=Adlercreutzia sp. ZJ242 TaxID=2709409 RepID=UPI00197E774F|nr:SIS domain-containing protein [Adlercreutzia sp. ZJ242]
MMGARCPQAKIEILDSLLERYPDMRSCEADVRAAADMLAGAFYAGNKLLVCGNGGSAADSEHVVGELMKGFRFKRPVDPAFLGAYRAANGEEAPAWLEGALPAISLVSHTALSTAFGNDEAAVGVFAQQVYGYGRPGDVLLAISTSGNSANVVEAAKVARARGMRVVSLTGSAESDLSALSDVCVRVPRDEVFQVQELHLPVYHCLCAAVEAELFGGAE